LNSSTKFNSLTIAFDTANGRHPRSIYVDGTEYVDDDAIFTIFNLSETESHSITITNWNVANSPIVITGIYVEISIDINKRNLISFNGEIFDRSDLKFPSFGVISNVGNIAFKDLDGEIRDYAEQLVLTSDLKVMVWLNNTLAKTRQQIGEFSTKEWDYDNDNRSVSVSLKDDLEKWQNIDVDGFGYYQAQETNQKAQSAKWFYTKLYQITVENGFSNMCAFGDLDIATQNILSTTFIEYPTLKSGSLWAQWQKLSEICQLHIYKNDKGIIVCEYNEGN
jgi:hypothetical protein